MPTFRAVNHIAPSSHPSPLSDVPLRGRPLVIASAAKLLDAFVFFYLRVPAALISWTTGQQAFNACMLLLLDAIELGEVTSAISNVEKAYAVFQKLQGVHKLASMAIERISWGLKELHDVTQMTSQPGTSQEEHDGDQMQGSQSEAAHAPHTMCGDAVMNATGMLLLEDPGLQGFVPEAFAPISWNFERAVPTHGFHAKPERNVFAAGQLRSPPPAVDDHPRSTVPMQGPRRSATLRAAPTRYATQTMVNPQPQGVTVPTSRAADRVDFDNGTQQQQPLIHHPPHSRHAQMREVATDPITAPILCAERFQRPQQGVGAQMRHKSYPSITLVGSAPPALRADLIAVNMQLRTAAKPVVSDQAPFQNYPWTTKTGGDLMSFEMAEDSLHSSHPPRVDMGSADVLHELPHCVPHTASSYPIQLSHAAAATSIPCAAEGASADEWRRW
jgi:hypothetical protein